ncbi:hypothetical protein IFM89_010736 [Coptis chinensis]|uniref:DUF4283 domain-containing protein n=1 Tax=Coptis chinensis TaxID=261450 RepID=A0A835ILC8_9MAGN|nr:hypothetical protein IFM89_010736 [Coptis chinensis]
MRGEGGIHLTLSMKAVDSADFVDEEKKRTQSQGSNQPKTNGFGFKFQISTLNNRSVHGITRKQERAVFVMECGDIIYRSTLPRSNALTITALGVVLALGTLSYLWATPGVAPGFWDMFVLAFVERFFRPTSRKDDFQLGKKLGEGAFGVVNKVSLTKKPGSKEGGLVLKRASEYGAVEIWMNERVRWACANSCADFCVEAMILKEAQDLPKGLEREPVQAPLSRRPAGLGGAAPLIYFPHELSLKDRDKEEEESSNEKKSDDKPKDIEKRKNTVKAIPIWLNLYNVPKDLWTGEGLGFLASRIGDPQRMDEATAARKRLLYARVCVLVEIASELPESYDMNMGGDDIRKISVEYGWIPKLYDHCKRFGHKIDGCLRRGNNKRADTQVEAGVNTNVEVDENSNSINVPGEVNIGHTDASTIHRRGEAVTEEVVDRTEGNSNEVSMSDLCLSAIVVETEGETNMVLDRLEGSELVVVIATAEVTEVATGNAQEYDSESDTEMSWSNMFAALVPYVEGRQSDDMQTNLNPLMHYDLEHNEYNNLLETIRNGDLFVEEPSED